MNWKERERRRSWPSLRHHPGSSRKELRKTTKNARMVIKTTNMRTVSTLVLGLTKCPIHWSVRSPMCRTLTSISNPTPSSSCSCA
jgi:hypothetical protein